MEIKQKKNILPWLLSAAALTVLITGIVMALDIHSYTFREDAWYPVMGNAFEIHKGDKAKIEKDQDYAVLTGDGASVKCTDNAAFFTGRKGLVTLASWEIVVLESDGSSEGYRLAPFTEVAASGNSVILSRGNKNKVVNAVFLFNGTDTFIPLKDAVLVFEDREVPLPAFSYVIANYGNWVRYENSETREYTIEYPAAESVRLQIPSAGTEIIPEMDLYSISGSEHMLISTLSFLDEYLTETD